MSNQTHHAVVTAAKLDNLQVGDWVSVAGFGDAPAPEAEVTAVGKAGDLLDPLAAILSGTDFDAPAVTLNTHTGGDYEAVSVPVAVLKDAYAHEARQR